MEKYLSAKELMEITGISKNGIYNLFKFPGFPSVRIGKRIVVSEHAFHEWMQRGGTEQKGA